jgi:D-sedoheptulose 7-phosphate isomerase
MSFTREYRTQLLDTLSKIDLSKVDQAIEWFKEARSSKKHIFTCGNGGSASTASHFVCDIVKGASYLSRH